VPQATSTHHAPWYAVPADDKENARLIVSQIVLDALKRAEDVVSQDDAEAAEGVAGDPEGAGVGKKQIPSAALPNDNKKSSSQFSASAQSFANDERFAGGNAEN
jgi:hypothetical protein